MHKSHFLILGAGSAIARQTAILLAHAGHSLCLAGRDTEEIEKIAKDIQIRTAHQVFVDVETFDIENLESHDLFLENIYMRFPNLDGVICAAGTMEPPAQRIMTANFNGIVYLFEKLACYFEQKKSGTIAAITSVAGDRGRKSNYLYGAAKGGLTIYLQGLQNRLFSSGVRVINFKLGFVDTAMTFGLPKLFCVASPEKIAEKIVRKINQKVNLTDTLYLPWFWFYIMFIIKSLPEVLFKRLSL